VTAPRRRLVSRKPLRPLRPRTSNYVVCDGDREVWRGPAPSIVRALDAAREALPELRGVLLNVTADLEVL
jgi:hypothetical protein